MLVDENSRAFVCRRAPTPSVLPKSSCQIDCQRHLKNRTSVLPSCEREGRTIVIAVNKVGPGRREAGALSPARKWTACCRRSRACRSCAVKQRRRHRSLMAAVIESCAVWNRRVPTAALNRFRRHFGQSAAGHCGAISARLSRSQSAAADIHCSRRVQASYRKRTGAIWSMRCVRIFAARHRSG